MEQILVYLLGDMEYMLRMVIAAICGGVIGFERSRRRKEAGLRTHIIVAVGSALLMIVSKYGFMDIVEIPGMRVDAGRIASNVITGISFLGAGVIFVREASIKGLTTAAGLWAMAGVGLAIGAGMYDVGIFATLLIMLIQIFTHSSLQKLDGPVRETVSVVYRSSEDADGLRELLQQHRIRVHHIQMEKLEDGSMRMKMEVTREHTESCVELAQLLAADENIKSFKL